MSGFVGLCSPSLSTGMSPLGSPVPKRARKAGGVNAGGTKRKHPSSFEHLTSITQHTAPHTNTNTTNAITPSHSGLGKHTRSPSPSVVLTHGTIPTGVAPCSLPSHTLPHKHHQSQQGQQQQGDAAAHIKLREGNNNNNTANTTTQPQIRSARQKAAAATAAAAASTEDRNEHTHTHSLPYSHSQQQLMSAKSPPPLQANTTTSHHTPSLTPTAMAPPPPPLSNTRRNTGPRSSGRLLSKASTPNTNTTTNNNSNASPHTHGLSHPVPFSASSPAVQQQQQMNAMQMNAMQQQSAQVSAEGEQDVVYGSMRDVHSPKDAPSSPVRCVCVCLNACSVIYAYPS